MPSKCLKSRISVLEWGDSKLAVDAVKRVGDGMGDFLGSGGYRWRIKNVVAQATDLGMLGFA